MKTARFLLGLGAVWLLTVAVISPAHAQEYSWGPWAGWYPYAFPHSAYRSGEIPTPPYFAIHPPVYYGRRVGMPYGTSPLTRPPRPFVEVEYQLPSPVSMRPVGLMISNPFVDAAQSPAGNTADVEPQAVVNPYVDQPSASKDASTKRKKTGDAVRRNTKRKGK